MADDTKRFDPISSKVSFPELEESVLERWRDNDTFGEVERVRAEAPMFVFYEGPPTANGSPGIHHMLSRSFKDVILRYKTMKGFRPLRRGGWDTHGLPVELEIEKELGLTTKREIEEFGIEEFNRRCRESVFRYVKEWEQMTERAGVWLDMDKAYVTYDNSYIEGAWWIFKKLWDDGHIYEGFKVTPHCPRCVTTLSSHEVALGYEEDTPDPSVYVRFPLKEAQTDQYGASDATLAALGYEGGAWPAGRPAFLAWTTTPWTLTANMALAVGPDEEYVLAEGSQTGEASVPERVVLAASLKDQALGEEGWETLASFRGSELVGLLYDPPYVGEELASHAHRVLAADYVTMDEGTGIVHTAPAYGAEDAELGKANGFPTVHTVDLRGILADGFPGAGKFVKEADKDLTKDLDQRGLLFKGGTIKHTYPFCWRCGTPLLYYAKASWYIQTTAVKDRMVAGNRTINWYPDHIKEGRFGEWLRNNVDWAVSRERYWGTPIPIWRCESCDSTRCVGGTAELAEHATPETKGLMDGLDLHRPYVDRVELVCEECDGVMKRVPEVADAWYDSGAMPFAQWAYPTTTRGPNGQSLTLNSVEDLIASPLFPADYITEAVDQTRGWFYSLLALSTLVTGKPSFQNCIVLGLILDGKGEKMS
ncbi:MAG: isoleucine--tRNA ligase, partial [Dehalococcoidia bacterium]